MLAKAMLESVVGYGDEGTFTGFGGFLTTTKGKGLPSFDIRATAFRGRQFVEGEFPRYAVVSEELTLSRLGLKPSIKKVGVVQKLMSVTSEQVVRRKRGKEIFITKEPIRIDIFEAMEKGFPSKLLKGVRELKLTKKKKLVAGVTDFGGLVPPMEIPKPKIKRPKGMERGYSIIESSFRQSLDRSIKQFKTRELMKGTRFAPFTEQKDNLKELRKVETLPRLESKPRLESVSRLEKMLRIETLPRLESVSRLETLPRFETISRVKTLTRLETLPRLETMMRTEMQPFTVMFRTLPPPPPPILLPSFGFEPPKKKKKLKKGEKLLRYQPSLVAVAKEIFGKRAKILTGLEIRPFI